MNYAIAALEDYLSTTHGKTEVLDTWADNLDWCNISGDDQEILDRYTAKRAYERRSF